MILSWGRSAAAPLLSVVYIIRVYQYERFLLPNIIDENHGSGYGDSAWDHTSRLACGRFGQDLAASRSHPRW
jgi:hypothetical protein